jgi:hypothetical protein
MLSIQGCLELEVCHPVAHREGIELKTRIRYRGILGKVIRVNISINSIITSNPWFHFFLRRL